MNQAQNYELLLQQLNSLLSIETDPVANMANTAAVLFNGLDNLNWAGFYVLKNGGLVLGPFQGKPACVRIALGKGVCGTAAQAGRTQRVEDVHKFPGHIACDSASQSEIVVPIFKNGAVWGVLDIDSPVLARFGADEQTFFEQVVRIFTTYTQL